MRWDILTPNAPMLSSAYKHWLFIKSMSELAQLINERLKRLSNAFLLLIQILFRQL